MMTTGVSAVPGWTVRPSAASAASAARAGARVGLLVGAGVALWVAARLVVGDADGPDVRLLTTALRWAAESTVTGDAAPSWRATVAPIAWAGILHIAVAALFGAAAAASAAIPRLLPRTVALLGILAAEYVAWRVAGGHAGPWLRTVIWYHLATAALTAVVVLEQVRAGGEHVVPRAERRGARVTAGRHAAKRRGAAADAGSTRRRRPAGIADDSRGREKPERHAPRHVAEPAS